MLVPLFCEKIIMDIYITQAPAWISISFGLLMISVPSVLIANAAKAANDQLGLLNSQILKRRILLFYTVFFLAIGAISFSGFFTVNTLPPRIIVFVSLPLLLFYTLVVQRKTWFKTIFEKIKVEQLVQIHLFRFVGVFFYLLYLHGALPKSFAIIGAAGDILTAAFAIPIIYLLKKKKPFAKALAWAWNVFGLLDILSVLTSAIIVTRIAVETNGAGVEQFGTFPFSWIPAFAPATILFLHLLIFKKLTKRE